MDTEEENIIIELFFYCLKFIFFLVNDKYFLSIFGWIDPGWRKGERIKSFVFSSRLTWNLFLFFCSVFWEIKKPQFELRVQMDIHFTFSSVDDSHKSAMWDCREIVQVRTGIVFCWPDINLLRFYRKFKKKFWIMRKQK